MPKIIEDLENRILLSARKRLLGGGLSSFSARGIAEDCGIAVGTIYNYYRDKESLMGAVMAQDWLQALSRARQTMQTVRSPEAGILCLYEAIRSFRAVYEGVWRTYPTGEGFGALFRARHKMLLEQIQGELEGLFARFCQALTAGQAVLLSELIIAASQHPEVGEEELLSLIRGGIEPRRV